MTKIIGWLRRAGSYAIAWLDSAGQDAAREGEKGRGPVSLPDRLDAEAKDHERCYSAYDDTPKLMREAAQRIRDLETALREEVDGMNCVCRLNPLVDKPVPCRTCVLRKLLEASDA